MLAASFTALVIAFGPHLYGALGGQGGSLRAALVYSIIVFAGEDVEILESATATSSSAKA